MLTTIVRPEENQIAGLGEIHQRLEEVRLLMEAGSFNAPALLWSAFEAAARLSLTELGRQADRPIRIADTPAGLSGQAVAYGVIDPDDRDVVLRLASASAADMDTFQRAAFIMERTLVEMVRQ